MKLYVGAWSDGDGGVFVASGNGKERYQLACDDGAAELRRVAWAILVDHLQDLERALAMREAFERQLGARLERSFWTVRENEIAEMIALIESGDRVV
jgi:hypothetical protein